jgi:cell division protein FtsI (penicillin-binding protein 3)
VPAGRGEPPRRRVPRRDPAEPTVLPLRRHAGTDGGRSPISDARRYTPRGRTVRDGGAGRDPFRPALELLHGEPDPVPAKPAAPRKAAPRKAAPRKAAPRKAAPRTAPPQPARSAPARKPAPARKAAGRPTVGKAAPTPPRRRPVRKPRRPLRLGEPASRLRVGTVVVLVLFTIIAGRLVMLQLTDARQYALAGLRDRLVTTTLFAPRGAIYDRDRNVLAHSVEARYVFADPSLIKAEDVPRIADALRGLLGVSASELTRKLGTKIRPNGSKDEFEYLARGVDIAVGNQVMALNLPGIGIGRDERRWAPGHDLAANLLGFASSSGGAGDGLTGRYGLEAGFDDLLAGTDGSRTFEVGQGLQGAQIPTGYQDEKPAHPGSSLQLTIDGSLQYKVQELLAKRMVAVNADFGSAVVLDVRTGEVLAQASYPSYDVDAPGSAGTAALLDANTQVVVDPGSVHKVITLGAGLQSGTITADSTITLPGPTIVKGDQPYRDTTPLPAGTRITLPGILAYSSNVGTISVASMMPAQTLYDFQRQFGLGGPTHEGIPGEAPGLVQPPANWSGSSYGSIPIGLGVSVTPLQMAAVYATIANGGVYVQPHLVKATVSPDGAVHPAAAPVTRRVLSEENAATLRQDLEAVVTAKGATGHSAAVPQYRVAGKTGTGSLVRDGRYAPGEVASFIGMAPVEAPRYLIAVFAHSPGGEGGAVAAPAFKEMMQFTLLHYGVPPTGNPIPTFTLTR